MVRPLFFLVACALSVPALAAEPPCSTYIARRQQFLSRGFHIREGKVRVAFFDADDTLRHARSGRVAPTGPDDVELLPGVAPKIAELARQGYLIAIVSNQGGVPRLTTLEIVDRSLLRTIELLAQGGAVVHYYDFAESYDENRKPKLGMLKRFEATLAAQADGAKIDYAGSLMVGDAAYSKLDLRPDGTPGTSMSNSDRRFAENAGLAFHEAKDFFGFK